MDILYLKEFKEAVETLLEAGQAKNPELMKFAKNAGISTRSGVGDIITYYTNHFNEFKQLPEETRNEIINAGKEEQRRISLNYTWQNTKNRAQAFIKAHPEYWGNYINKSADPAQHGLILDKAKFIKAIDDFMYKNPEVEKINPEELITPDNKFNVNHPWVKNNNNRAIFAKTMFEPWKFSPEQLEKAQDDLSILIRYNNDIEKETAYSAKMKQRDENWKNTRQILKHDTTTGKVGQEDFANTLAGKEDKLNMEDNLLDFADYDIVDEAKSGNELRAIKNLRNFMKTYKKEPTIIKMFKDYCLTSLAKNGIETELLADELM